MSKKQHRKADASEKPGLSKAQKGTIINSIGTGVMFVVLGLVLYAVVFRGAQRPSRQMTAQHDRQATTAQQKDCPTTPGQPWEYDRETQCYFDPSPGHGHWHVGKPPAESEREKLMAGK